MATDDTTHSTAAVASRIFEDFLAQLVDTGVPKAVVAELRKTLVDEGKHSDSDLLAALMAEEDIP